MLKVLHFSNRLVSKYTSLFQQIILQTRSKIVTQIADPNKYKFLSETYKILLPGFYCKITEQKRKIYGKDISFNGSITETEVLIPGSGSFRRGTETELLRNGSTKTRTFCLFYFK